MSHESNNVLESPLELVKYRFEQWRERKMNRRERIPEELWSAALGLLNRYSVNQISLALRLNYNDVKKRIPACLHETANREQAVFSKRKQLSSADFVELDWQSGLSAPLSTCLSERDQLQSGKAQAGECVIEMEDAYGSKMRMSFSGRADLDLLEIGKAFWSKGK